MNAVTTRMTIMTTITLSQQHDNTTTTNARTNATTTPEVMNVRSLVS
jgi:hypothetical protein